MGKIYKYRKVTDAITTYCLIEPDYNLLKTKEHVEELDTIDSWTYVSVPDSIALPPQPEQIHLTEAESPQVARIKMMVVEKIRLKYSINDEIKLLRIGASKKPIAFDEYNKYAEECRAWGEAEKTKLVISN
jgi:hypothetical protein